ncbi:uncharacterized protein LOC144647170 [Oculina patagonica]
MADNCIQLRELQISERKLRFLEWASTDATDSDSQISQDSIPLFLGADVLSGCSIAVSNLPRMHAKFSKQGLAVKVNFPTPLRLQGVHGSARGVWFYSIQGLFRVCFEYYNREEQLECMKQLCTTWKLRFSDPPLQQEIEIGFQGGPSKCLATPELSGESSPAETSELNDDFNLSESRCTQSPQTVEISNSVPTCSSLDNCYLTPNLKQYIEEIVRLFKNEDQCEFNYLLETTMRILREFEFQKSQKQNRLSRTLLAISKCLGDEFNKLQPEINERVTEFKKKHITSIDNLPPSSTLVKELFPECMRVLLLSWMGSENRQNINSIVQVILELANTSLVSGVAHVLYSRLIRTDTV